MIKSFKDAATEAAFNGEASKQVPANIVKVARRKLRMVHQARELRDLLVPPKNMLETLKGSRKGQHSIRVNDRYRVCFVWTPAGPENVEVVDYHDEP
jgi:proteic killer suppression protein